MYNIKDPFPEFAVPKENVPDSPVPVTTIPLIAPELFPNALPKSQMFDAVFAPVTSDSFTNAISNSPPEFHGETVANPDTENVWDPAEVEDPTVRCLKYS